MYTTRSTFTQNMGECESKAEFVIIDGKIEEINIKNVAGKKPLTGKKLKDFQVFLQNYSESIVQKWIDYFVYHKDISIEKITKKI